MTLFRYGAKLLSLLVSLIPAFFLILFLLDKFPTDFFFHLGLVPVSVPVPPQVEVCLTYSLASSLNHSLQEKRLSFIRNYNTAKDIILKLFRFQRHCVLNFVL